MITSTPFSRGKRTNPIGCWNLRYVLLYHLLYVIIILGLIFILRSLPLSGGGGGGQRKWLLVLLTVLSTLLFSTVPSVKSHRVGKASTVFLWGRTTNKNRCMCGWFSFTYYYRTVRQVTLVLYDFYILPLVWGCHVAKVFLLCVSSKRQRGGGERKRTQNIPTSWMWLVFSFSLLFQEGGVIFIHLRHEFLACFVSSWKLKKKNCTGERFFDTCIIIIFIFIIIGWAERLLR